MPVKKEPKKRIRIIIGSIVAALLIGVFSFILLFLKNIEEKSTQFLTESVRKHSNDRYTLEIKKTKINIVKMSAVLQDVDLKINEEYAAIDTNAPPSVHYRVKAKEIKLSAQHIFTALWKKSELVIDKLEIVDPEISMTPLKNGSVDSLFRKSDSHRVFPSFVHGFTLKEIAVSNGTFKRYKMENPDEVFFKVDGINLLLHTFYFNLQDTASQAKTLFDRLHFESNRAACSINDYEIAIEGIGLDEETKMLSIDTLSIIPIFNKYIFPEKTRRPTAAELVAHDILISRLHVEELFFHHQLFLDSVVVGGYKVNTFKNKNVPPTPNIKPLFSEMVWKISFPMKIDKIIVNNGTIHHEEIAKGKEAIGKVQFHNFGGVVTNITNIQDGFLEECVANIHGEVYESGELHLRYSTAIDSTTTRYSLSGELQNLELSEANAISEAAANIQIESGVISDLSFSISADHQKASIKMLMLYQDFEISLLRPDHEKKRRLISEIANDFVIINANPKGKKAPREAKETMLRNPYYFQINHIWNTILLGIEKSIGLGEKELKLMQKQKKK